MDMATPAASEIRSLYKEFSLSLSWGFKKALFLEKGRIQELGMFTWRKKGSSQIIPDPVFQEFHLTCSLDSMNSTLFIPQNPKNSTQLFLKIPKNSTQLIPKSEFQEFHPDPSQLIPAGLEFPENSLGVAKGGVGSPWDGGIGMRWD
ncbi:hypothetical protein HGM15179_018369 [Zosterops borbonicus]|uniref:Uncharacterized protein n=1 Tax=Zosterops borbonicus TaxID=364589 RepID=A0A8K1FZ69_9PASS|nr:hypothetical protein HGM15179_018369 [Zosterops borbonicus]